MLTDRFKLIILGVTLGILFGLTAVSVSLEKRVNTIERGQIVIINSQEKILDMFVTPTATPTPSLILKVPVKTPVATRSAR